MIESKNDIRNNRNLVAPLSDTTEGIKTVRGLVEGHPDKLRPKVVADYVATLLQSQKEKAYGEGMREGVEDSCAASQRECYKIGAENGKSVGYVKGLAQGRTSTLAIVKQIAEGMIEKLSIIGEKADTAIMKGEFGKGFSEVEANEIVRGTGFQVLALTTLLDSIQKL